VTKGYLSDHADLMDFLQRFGATKDGMIEHWKKRLASPFGTEHSEQNEKSSV